MLLPPRNRGETVDDPEEAALQRSAVEQPSHLRNPAARQATVDSLWHRIKRHKVVEWSLAYIAFGYAVLHGSQMLRETLEWPAAVPRFTLLALLFGFPIAVTLAWYHGHRAQHRVSRTEIAILSALLLLAGSALWVVARTSHGRGSAAVTPTATLAAPIASVAFSPPAHSVAVLPFTNLSGDPKQEYFSDGLSEELINALSHIQSIEVAARTSAFYFKGKDADIGTIARKLNVGAVLEGSVRRSGHRVRITAQLINAVTGFHLWSEDYDRDLKDNLSLQTEIATTVARELQGQLLGTEAASIELGGTHNAEAYDAYLRGLELAAGAGTEADLKASLKEFDDAIELDPNYALAHASRAIELIDLVVESKNPATREHLAQEASASARRALALAPDLPRGHGALSFVRALGFFDFAGGLEESERAVALAPGSASAQHIYAVMSGWAAHHDTAIRGFRTSVRLDPQNYRYRINLALALQNARRFDEALAAVRDAQAIKPDGPQIGEVVAESNLALGRPSLAKRACEDTNLMTTEPERYRHWCLALSYHALGIPVDAERELTNYQAESGEGAAYEQARLYAQWGKPIAALHWLGTAYRLRDTGIQIIKSDWMLDPVRSEPEFKALERRLNFPP